MGEYMLTSLAGLTSLLLLSRAEILQTFLQLLADLSRDLLVEFFRFGPLALYSQPDHRDDVLPETAETSVFHCMQRNYC
jgi:hypothetical protein